MKRARPPVGVVTGVGSGIGRALGVRMAQEGWRVIGARLRVEERRLERL